MHLKATFKSQKNTTLHYHYTEITMLEMEDHLFVKENCHPRHVPAPGFFQGVDKDPEVPRLQLNSFSYTSSQNNSPCNVS